MRLCCGPPFPQPRCSRARTKGAQRVHSTLGPHPALQAQRTGALPGGGAAQEDLVNGASMRDGVPPWQEGSWRQP